jgi:hypothetical protein
MDELDELEKERDKETRREAQLLVSTSETSAPTNTP